MAENQKRVEFVSCRKLCAVDPGTLEVRSGETVEFANATSAELRIFFARKDLFDVELVAVERGSSRKLLVTAKPPAGPVVYHYSVFCDETDSFAVGGSNPRIILNR
jgi:plastocyanin